MPGRANVTTLCKLSERYGLFYFFAQSCGACEVMSPIVQSVAATWSITVRAISTDGGPSRHFPNYTVENDQRSKMGLEPKITPAVVLWDAERAAPFRSATASCRPTNCRTAFTSSPRRKPDVIIRFKRATAALLIAALPFQAAIG